MYGVWGLVTISDQCFPPSHLLHCVHTSPFSGVWPASPVHPHPSSAFTPPPLCSHFPHRGLAGKPGAARKALAALEAERQARREQEDAQKAQEAAEKVSASSADEGGAASDGGSGTSGFLEQPTLLDDDEDELLASLRPEEDEGEEGEGAAEEALVEKAEGEA